MKREKGISFTVVVLFFAIFLSSCGRGRKSTKEKAESGTEKTVRVIKQGSENQAYEDSIKRVKNELKK